MTEQMSNVKKSHAKICEAAISYDVFASYYREATRETQGWHVDRITHSYYF
jgi:hypothetical protein